MTPRIIAFALAAATSGVAFADDKPVHARATVEVLDDKAQIDDVISRLRDEQQKQADQAKKTNDQKTAGKLRDDRPPPPSTMSDSHRALAPEAKIQPPGSRRPLRDNLNFERAERPRPKHK